MSDVTRYECALDKSATYPDPDSVSPGLSTFRKFVILRVSLESEMSGIFLSPSDALALAADLTRLASEAKSRGGE